MNILSMTTKITGAAKASQKMNAWKAKLPGAVDKNLKKQAHRLRAIIIKGIRSGKPGGQEFEPLAESTIMQKGSSKPLIDHGDLIGSITVTGLGSDDGYFVGVKKKSVDDEGNPLANIAEIMETGTDPYDIPVTSAMRGFMMYQASQGKIPKGMAIGLMHRSVIHHPGLKPRPFMEPSFNEWAKDAEKLFMDGIRRALGVR